MILCNNKHEGIIGELMIQEEEIQRLYQYMLENNPEFEKFVKSREFETTEEIEKRVFRNVSKLERKSTT